MGAPKRGAGYPFPLYEPPAHTDLETTTEETIVKKNNDQSTDVMPADDEQTKATPRHERTQHGGTHHLKSLGHKAKVGLTVAAVVVALVAGLAIGNRGIVTAGATRADSTTIKNSFTDIAQLVTQEYDYTDVGKYSKDDAKLFDISIPFTGSSFLVTYNGSVTAGIKDITQSQVSIDDSTQTVSVTLPDVEVLDSHIDTNSVETYDQTFNPISQISVDEVTGFLSDREDYEKDTAVNSGLLDKARQHAEDVVTEHVKALLANTSQKDYQVSVNWLQSDDSGSSSTDSSNS